MQESDKRHFWEMLQGLGVSARGGEVTAPVLKVYWLALNDLPREDFDKAIKRALDDCDYFPSVKELRKFAGHGKKPPEPAYLRPAEDELERIETCQFHTRAPQAPSTDYVPWCRKCRRLRIAGANGRGHAQSIGELLQVKAMAPLDPEGERR
jgi:hypothetical protein